MTRKKKPVKRVVLGVGYPVMISTSSISGDYYTVRLYASNLAESIGTQPLALRGDRLSGWKKIRLVAETIS